jgi:hypothetical protein
MGVAKQVYLRSSQSSHPDKVEQTAELTSSAVFLLCIGCCEQVPHPSTTKNHPASRVAALFRDGWYSLMVVASF